MAREARAGGTHKIGSILWVLSEGGCGWFNGRMSAMKGTGWRRDGGNGSSPKSNAQSPKSETRQALGGPECSSHARSFRIQGNRKICRICRNGNVKKSAVKRVEWEGVYESYDNSTNLSLGLDTMKRMDSLASARSALMGFCLRPDSFRLIGGLSRRMGSWEITKVAIVPKVSMFFREFSRPGFLPVGFTNSKSVNSDTYLTSLDNCEQPGVNSKARLLAQGGIELFWTALMLARNWVKHKRGSHFLHFGIYRRQSLRNFTIVRGAPSASCFCQPFHGISLRDEI